MNATASFGSGWARIATAARVMLLTCTLAGCGRMSFDSRTADAPGAGDGPNADAAVPPGAVLWAPMESINGTNIDDIAGGHIILCNQADCPTPVAGKRGGALRFPGTGPLFVEARADLDPTAGFTIAAWVNLDAYSGGQGYSCIASKPVGTGDLDSYSLCVQDDMMSLFYTANGSTDDYLRGPTVPLGEWHHLAMTWDGTTKRGYYDGVQVANDVVSVAADATPVKLAGDVNGGSNVYMVHGALDEVMIYGRALDATEIPQLVR